MRKALRFSVVLLFSAVGIYLLLWLTPWRRALPGYHSVFYTQEAYLKTSSALRQDMAAAPLKQRGRLLRKGVSEKLFPYWAGTRWSFSGTTVCPGKGSVACGYFVTTVLRDAGCTKVERVRMAQQASEEFIRGIVQEKNIRRYSGISIGKFLADVRRRDDQLYVVGLDTHVGFLSCESGQCWFIHSSGRFPWCVVKEKAEESAALRDSNYRVTACLSADEQFLSSIGDR